MQNELNLTPTQGIIVIIVCLVILVLLWQYDKPSNISDTKNQQKHPRTTLKSAMVHIFGFLTNITIRGIE